MTSHLSSAPSSKSESFGMMDGAYFVGRREILEWINGLLQLDLQKIEQTASGCVALQLLDSLHPGCIAMNKVDWNAKQDFQFVANYKLLQTGFDKLGIGKHVPVDQLIRAKYQDNLEFMQWFKRYHDNTGIAPDYDPVAARAGGKGAPGASGGPVTAGNGQNAVTTNGKPRPLAPRRNTGPATASNAAKAVVKRSGHSAVNGASSGATTKANAAVATSGSAPAGMAAAAAAAAAAVASADERIAELQRELDAEKTLNGTLEQERQFYFEKLRDVESLLQLREEHDRPIDGASDIFKILYATQESVVAVSEAGEVLEGDAALEFRNSAIAAEQAEEAEQAEGVAAAH